MHQTIVYTDSSPQFDYFQATLLDPSMPKSESFRDWLSAWKETKPSPVTTHLFELLTRQAKERQEDFLAGVRFSLRLGDQQREYARTRRLELGIAGFNYHYGP